MRLHSTLTLAFALFSGSQAFAVSYSSYVVIPNVPGESTSDKYARSIEASSVSLGIVNRLCTGFTIVKSLDIASAPLAGAAASGAIYPLVTVYLVRNGELAQNFATYVLQNSSVASITSVLTNSVFNESVTLSPATVAVTYKPQNPDGSLGGAITYNMTCSKPK